MTAYHGVKLVKNKYYFDHGKTLREALQYESRANHTHPSHTHMGLSTRVVEGPVSPPLVDVYPTVRYLLDFEVPEGIRGGGRGGVGSSEILLVN